ncbi:MAG TPA: hypothetical protein VF094_02315 [Gaiellaceae bacterium]
MKVERLAVLQWVGVLVGAIAWTLAHVAGIGVTYAECNAAGRSLWHLSNPAWQAPIMGVTAIVIVFAEICAIAAFRQTRGLDFGDGPPEPEEKPERRRTRIHFFAAAAIMANLLFLMIVLLDGTANLADFACQRS